MLSTFYNKNVNKVFAGFIALWLIKWYLMLYFLNLGFTKKSIKHLYFF